MACQVNDFTLRYEAYAVNYYETLQQPCPLTDEKGAEASNLIAPPVTTKSPSTSTFSGTNRLNLIDQNYRHYDHKELMARNGSRGNSADQEVIITPTAQSTQSWHNFWWLLGGGAQDKSGRQLYVFTSLDKGDYRPAIGCALITSLQMLYIVAVVLEHLPSIIIHSLLWLTYAVFTYFLFRVVGHRAYHSDHYHLSAWSMLLPSPLTLIMIMLTFIFVVIFISILLDERREQYRPRQSSVHPSHLPSACVHRRSVRVPLILPKDMDLDNI